jgi:metal-responsive CopG/Arc/MetJ family transcriptional regulator
MKNANPKAVIHASVDNRLAQEMARVARKEGVTLSSLVEEALRMYYRKIRADKESTSPRSATPSW